MEKCVKLEENDIKKNVTLIIMVMIIKLQHDKPCISINLFAFV